jgi:hypothetical protein
MASRRQLNTPTRRVGKRIAARQKSRQTRRADKRARKDARKDAKLAAKVSGGKFSAEARSQRLALAGGALETVGKAAAAASGLTGLGSVASSVFSGVGNLADSASGAVSSAIGGGSAAFDAMGDSYDSATETATKSGLPSWAIPAGLAALAAGGLYLATRGGKRKAA